MGLDTFIGQDVVKAKIRFQIELAKKQGVALNHILLCGQYGEGKAYLATCIADEMSVSIKLADADTINLQGDLAALLTNLREGNILLIENIEILNQAISVLLTAAMRDCKLELIVGKGSGSRRISLKLPRFAVIGATPHHGRVRESLRNSFNVVLDFGWYDQISLANLLLREAKPQSGVTISSKAAEVIAYRANGRLHSARKLASQVRDYAIVQGHQLITEEVVLETFGNIGIDEVSVDPTGVTFEKKCMELLVRRGFEVTTTRTTSDGGIDLIAFSGDPFLGGKYVVQCKGWAGPVGAPIVRDLYGVVHSENANKGILIAASSFSQEALDFAAGKRLELIDGSRLSFLASQE